MMYPAQMKYRLKRSIDISNILKNLATELDTAKKIFMSHIAAPKIDTMSEDRNFSLHINDKLTKYQYMELLNQKMPIICVTS